MEVLSPIGAFNVTLRMCVRGSQIRHPPEFPVVLSGDRAVFSCWLVLQKGSELRSKTRQDPSHFPEFPVASIEIHSVYVTLGRKLHVDSC